MTKERTIETLTIEALDACAKHLRIYFGDLDPVKCQTRLEGRKLKGRERAGHLLYMTETAVQFVVIGKTEKAMRWLGFIQGAMWSGGYISIDDLKQMNMPKEEQDEHAAGGSA
jgi:hypothetical protein